MTAAAARAAVVAVLAVAGCTTPEQQAATATAQAGATATVVTGATATAAVASATAAARAAAVASATAVAQFQATATAEASAQATAAVQATAQAAAQATQQAQAVSTQQAQQAQAQRQAQEQAKARAVQAYLRENFGTPPLKTTWYDNITRVEVSGDLVEAHTNLPLGFEATTKAPGICTALRFFVFDPARGDLALARVAVMARDDLDYLVTSNYGSPCAASNALRGVTGGR